MRFTRTRKRAAAAVFAAVAVAGIGIGTATSAQAAEGSWTFSTGGCAAVEDITLGSDYHDYMEILPTQNPGHCLFGVFNRNTWSWMGGGASGSSNAQGWFYDGPGQSLEACLIDTANNNTWACGPIN
ncbi:hypothetical protein P3T37_006116 [Kitasatospora sp. MAA4]|uniref:hypothetical protein n=1 Tax=Kitasatospora sp. MAA4 TaxID=3035093 RepID=UPI0024752D78|nr:hypothetical protein [Kitasatospora sp. MAA4]MDH6136685.1 hypothetical protein [Kitasatospora sp. MAA4]